MKICLVRPPALIDIKGFSIDPTPPLGLAYIASVLIEAGHQVEVIDSIGEGPNELFPIEFTPKLKEEYKKGRLYTNGIRNSKILELISEDVEIIGLSCMFSNNWLSDRHLISLLGDKFPNALIIAGGESITAKPDLWMNQAPHLKICIMGEGEETIVELINTLEKKEDIASVSGITYRDENNQYITTAKKNRIKDIDEIPTPAWDLFPIANYHKYKMQYTVTDKNVLPIMATRGCPYSCTFCSSPQMWGTRYYMRSPQKVADEIEGLIKKYNATEIDFYDLTAIIKKDWIIEFSNEVVKRNLNIKWNIPAGTRSESIDDEVARHLYLSGCKDITYAPESGSLKILKLIKKKVNLENMLESMSSANKYEMRIYLNIIFGLPGETHSDIWKTILYLIKSSWVGAYEIGLATFHPYPGSLLFENLVKEGKIDLSTDDFFYKTITLTPASKSEFHYNEEVSARWYQFYSIISYILFFSTNYLFRPKRFFIFVRNVFSKNYKSRFERTITRLLHNERYKEKNLNDVESIS